MGGSPLMEQATWVRLGSREVGVAISKWGSMVPPLSPMEYHRAKHKFLEPANSYKFGDNYISSASRNQKKGAISLWA